MLVSKYGVSQQPVSQLLAAVEAGQIAIPELQRPFVWKSPKVRDLLDSLYQGYPVGYLITWQSVGAALKGGGAAGFQQILIDGQQRVTALRAAVLGQPVVDDRYRKVRIVIAFNPITEKFETVTPVIRKNPEWIADVSEFFGTHLPFGLISDYFERNPDVDRARAEASFQRLAEIRTAPIGIINLAADLDVEEVSEIFIRINSEGVRLSNADFAMSKIATYGERGRNLRKLIDYFANLAVAPHAYEDIAEHDRDFAASSYFSAIEWLRNESEDLYDPTYGDLIRVAGLVGFSQGRAASIVNELSGRDPETRSIDETRIPRAYDRLEGALLEIVKRFNFENFLMTIKSAGFIAPRMISSRNALNFAYALYLRLRADGALSEGERKRIVRRWFVMSLLTGRSAGSFETAWQLDIRRIAQLGAAEHLAQIEAAELTDGFWEVGLPNSLETTSTASPFFQTYLASQVTGGARGFLSKHITVKEMTEHAGDLHHIVPKDYLQKHGYPDRADYNQVANFALTETSINISISNDAPAEYLSRVDAQIGSGLLRLGEITDGTDLERNLEENAIPPFIRDVDASRYPDFLAARRRLISAAIRGYYENL